MSSKKLFLCFILIFVFLVVFSFTQEEKKILLGSSHMVYVIPGENVFHLKSCEKIKNRFTAMKLSYALEKGYKPCPICIPMKSKQEESKIKKEQELVEAESTDRSKKIIQVEQKNHFRNADWGMSKEEIKKIEKNEFFQEQHSDESGLDIIIYKGNAGGLDCLIGYYFAENQLVEGRYVFAEKHTNRNDYIDDFHGIKNSISKQYGDPTDENRLWKDDLYKDDYSDWGLAISIGHLVYGSEWRLPETTINLQLYGDNYKISHSLSYTPEIPKYKKLREDAKKVIW